jgi:DNA-directed RNA polymerase subunit N (RpoN/RPB10)
MSLQLCVCKRRNADKILLFRYFKKELEKQIMESKYNGIKPEILSIVNLNEIHYGKILDFMGITELHCRMELLSYVTEDEIIK